MRYFQPNYLVLAAPPVSHIYAKLTLCDQSQGGHHHHHDDAAMTGHHHHHHDAAMTGHHEHEENLDAVWKGLTALSGVYFMFLIEHFLTLGKMYKDKKQKVRDGEFL